MVFVDQRTGTPYLYAGGSAGSTLRVWELEPDMMRVKRRVPVETPRLFTEGAFMHVRNGVYYLSYSHGRFGRVRPPVQEWEDAGATWWVESWWDLPGSPTDPDSAVAETRRRLELGPTGSS